MSDFLEKLRKAADTGEFNSEAAKKILEINELADKKIGAGKPEDIERLKKTLTKRIVEPEEVKSGEAVPVEPETVVEEVKSSETVVEEVKSSEVVPEEEILELNSEYEKKMANIKLLDAVTAQLATLIEIEDMVVLSIGDMFGYVNELEDKFRLEFEAENPIFGDLYQKIEAVKSKYKIFINN